MSNLPELVPISDFRLKQSEVLAGLTKGPVILTQYSKGAAVLMSIEQYNRMLELIEDLQDALDALESRQDAGAVDFDDYLTKRGEHVPAFAEA